MEQNNQQYNEQHHFLAIAADSKEVSAGFGSTIQQQIATEEKKCTQAIADGEVFGMVKAMRLKIKRLQNLLEQNK